MLKLLLRVQHMGTGVEANTCTTPKEYMTLRTRDRINLRADGFPTQPAPMYVADVADQTRFIRPKRLYLRCDAVTIEREAP